MSGLLPTPHSISAFTRATDGLSVLGKTASESKFWNEYTETLPREQLDALHLQRLQAIVDYAYHCSPFYRRKFDACGLKPGDIQSLDDFKRKVPLTDKSEFVEQQLAAPPYGPTLALPEEFVAHHCETSGTTGKPLAIPYSMYDTVRYGESWVYGYLGARHPPRPTRSISRSDGEISRGSGAPIGAPAGSAAGSFRAAASIPKDTSRRSCGCARRCSFRRRPSRLRLAAVAAEMGIDVSQSSIKLHLPRRRARPDRTAGDARGDREGVGRKIRRVARHRRGRRDGARLPERRRRPRQRNERLFLVDEPRYRRRGRRWRDRREHRDDFRQYRAASAQLPQPRSRPPPR